MPLWLQRMNIFDDLLISGLFVLPAFPHACKLTRMPARGGGGTLLSSKESKFRLFSEARLAQASTQDQLEPCLCLDIPAHPLHHTTTLRTSCSRMVCSLVALSKPKAGACAMECMKMTRHRPRFVILASWLPDFARDLVAAAVA